MNREIKFRGLSKNGFVYGLPYYAPGTGIWSIVHSDGCVPTYNNPDQGESNVFIDIDPKTLGQFTGLHDKNGKEIYEGDILRGNGYLYVVSFQNGAFIVDTTFDFLMRYKAKCEIIGNIYQNRDLYETSSRA